MTVPTLTVLSMAVVAVFAAPRQWVPVPFLALACYIPKAQVVDLGPFSFTPLRTLIVVALLRAVIRSDWKGLTLRLSDHLMLAWSVLMVVTVALHANPAAQVVERLGLALDAMGLYVVFRLCCRSSREIAGVCGALALVLVPLAAAMAYERATNHNVMSFFGGTSEMGWSRDGQIRARGPFRHAILAGTIGALSIPFMVALWPRVRVLAAIGLAASLAIVVSSHSSGPLMSLAAAGFALALWPLRQRLHQLRWAGLAAVLLLSAVMNRPVYYLIGEIDLTGSSTGWHRARLIESSLKHLDEWWLAGTDYTRHWMATGVSWSADHTDLTNHYIALGVYGGLPLLLTFLAVIVVSFYYVGRNLDANGSTGPSSFLAWAVGSALFAVAVTSVSISYFDQSILWLYMTMGFCGGLAGAPVTAANQARVAMSFPAIVASHRARHRAWRRLRAQASSSAGLAAPHS